MSIEATLARVSAIKQALADPAMLVGSGGVATGGTEAPGTPAAGAQPSFASALAQASNPQGAAVEPPGAAASALADSPAALAGSSTALAGYPAALAGSTAGVASPTALQSLDGVVGSAALSPLQAAGQSSPGARIVAIAESQLGQAEQAPGSNESPAIAQYRGATAGAVPGAPWCAYFASWVARQAGEPIGEGGQGAGAVSEVWSWAQSSGRAIPKGSGVAPQPGDLIVFGDEHVGIVRDVLPNGQIQTIEGNYENKVAANVRSPTEATGYVNMS
jgi:CHAP domain